MKVGSRKALIEVGTNSVKFLVAEKNDIREGLSYLEDRSEITRIGEGLDESGRLSEAPVERTLDCIHNFLKEADILGVEDISVVATMALRKASNPGLFIESLKEKEGLGLRVLSGEEEARYSFLGLVSTLPDDGAGWYFDTGGGSTEFVSFSAGKTLETFSLDVGAVTVTEKFMDSTGGDRRGSESACRWIESFLDDKGLRTMEDGGHLIGSGGNVMTMASVSVAPEKLSFSEKIALSLSEIDRQIEIYGRVSLEERKSIPGMDPKRASVILAGACIVRSICRVMEVDNMMVSPFGLRHGLMSALFDGDVFV